MEIIKRKSAASANIKVDEKQLKTEKEAIKKAVSYTHLTLPTKA